MSTSTLCALVNQLLWNADEDKKVKDPFFKIRGLITDMLATLEAQVGLTRCLKPTRDNVEIRGGAAKEAVPPKQDSGNFLPESWCLL